MSSTATYEENLQLLRAKEFRPKATMSQEQRDFYRKSIAELVTIRPYNVEEMITTLKKLPQYELPYDLFFNLVWLQVDDLVTIEDRGDGQLMYPRMKIATR